LFGSIFFLLGFFSILSISGCTDFRILAYFDFSLAQQLFIFFTLFIFFALKAPIIPLHIWLPEAHVEAPTVGSVILASLLLKVSVYGFFRILVSTVLLACQFFEPLLVAICLISFLFASILSIRQVDFKKLIAYSSIVHMSIALLGLCLVSNLTFIGSILASLSHGFISGGLFFGAGFLYDRFNTRNLVYFGGLLKFLPLLGVCFFILCIGNFSFPGFLSFIGEFLLLLGIFKASNLICYLACFILIFSTVYSIWLFDHVFCGLVNPLLINFQDLLRYEFFILFSLIFVCFFFGVFPGKLISFFPLFLFIL
jgi:proton-translocating NADH-quinone oxidoreductase chain M